MLRVPQTMQIFEIFIMVGKSSLQEMATLAIIQQISHSNLELGR